MPSLSVRLILDDVYTTILTTDAVATYEAYENRHMALKAPWFPQTLLLAELEPEPEVVAPDTTNDYWDYQYTDVDLVPVYKYRTRV